MDKTPDGLILSPLQLKPDPRVPGVVNVQIEIKVDWRFMLNMLSKWIRGKPFRQRIQFKHHVLPK